MDVIRINMSHSDHKFAKKVIERTKKLNKTLSSPIGILLDTQGPEIRTGDTSHLSAYEHYKAEIIKIKEMIIASEKKEKQNKKKKVKK